MQRDEILLERLTRPEVEAALVDGFNTVVVPCGSVEQHGPHLPLFVDAEIGTRLGIEVARRLGKTLVAPTIRIGCSEHHMGFAGTITLRETTFKSVCVDYCSSLARHGFTRICMLPSHGGNFQPLADVLEELNEVAGPNCQVVAFTDMMALIETWKASVEAESGLGARVGGHADIAESSVMLCLYPELVQTGAAQAGCLDEISQDLVDRILTEGFRSVTPSGILGDARGMSPQIGERCITDAADLIVGYFESKGSSG